MDVARALVLAAVRVYRRHLSHRKGYHCACGRLTGRDTCSGVGLLDSCAIDCPSRSDDKRLQRTRARTARRERERAGPRGEP